ncbi:hypothetical protein K504DRAFT_449341 [Pleomassaria siparia CBS 279.74]|uniref:Uncharacterized protein n=1 Tax=Pleomassaria siparia CBS 279.74 TaxID=1314801 RepID=A0A6G1JW50_9PLEO|nr:hypothetical protein K504DRAFT_449341 [Pleomassaria siparia CBS 279.74]
MYAIKTDKKPGLLLCYFNASFYVEYHSKAIRDVKHELGRRMFLIGAEGYITSYPAYIGDVNACVTASSSGCGPATSYPTTDRVESNGSGLLAILPLVPLITLLSITPLEFPSSCNTALLRCQLLN